LKAKETHFQMVFKECDFVFYVVSNEGGDHENETSGEKEHGPAAKTFVNLHENVALNPEHQSDEGNYFYHVIEMFFARDLERCRLIHTSLSEVSSDT
jgi:hypothetical protein